MSSEKPFLTPSKPLWWNVSQDQPLFMLLLHGDLLTLHCGWLCVFCLPICVSRSKGDKERVPFIFVLPHSSAQSRYSVRPEWAQACSVICHSAQSSLQDVCCGYKGPSDPRKKENICAPPWTLGAVLCPQSRQRHVWWQCDSPPVLLMALCPNGQLFPGRESEIVKKKKSQMP